MNKFSKIGAAALFALFLTACDKPADNAAQSAAEPAAQTAAQNSGAEDYQKYQNWQREQEQLLNDSMRAVMEQGGSEQEVQTALVKVLAERIEQIRETSNALNIQDPEVNALKEKAVEVMNIGVQMLTEQEKAGSDVEAHKAVIELSEKLQKVAEEGQALEAALMQKYGIQLPVETETPAETPAEAAPAAEKADN